MEAFQRATAWIDVGALERNCGRLVEGLRRRAALCAVVKADGYGHGMLRSAKAALAGGARMLAVATASEAFELRQAEASVPILVMGALTEAELDAALAARAEVGVWDPGFLEVVATRGAALGLRPRVHVKYDTGMGRLGAREADLVESLLAAADRDGRLEAAGLWTHLATADEEDRSYMDEQLERFAALALPARERHGVELHAANSAATLREPEAHFDMVRCGVAIYGLDPFGSDPRERGLEPVLGLSSYVAAVKSFRDGESAGYGRRWRAAGESRLAVVPIGYGDGVRRGLTNRFEVIVGERRLPAVGTVSMDNITVELGTEDDVAVGDEVVLLGPGTGSAAPLLAERWARTLETINYEITCGISVRVPRVERR